MFLAVVIFYRHLLRHMLCPVLSVDGARRLRRRSRVRQGVCGVNVPLRTPKRRRQTHTGEGRKSAVKEKNVQIYSREKRFSPTSVVIKTNPLFSDSCSATPQRLPCNFQVMYMHEHVHATCMDMYMPLAFSSGMTTCYCCMFTGAAAVEQVPSKLHSQDKGGGDGECHH